MRRLLRVLLLTFLVIVALNVVGFLVNPGCTFIDLTGYYAVDRSKTSGLPVQTKRMDRPPGVEYQYRSGPNDEAMVRFPGGRADVDVFSIRHHSLFGGLGLPVLPVFFFPSGWAQNLVLRFSVSGRRPPTVEANKIWIETASGETVFPAPNLPTAVCRNRGDVVFDETRDRRFWSWMLCYPVSPAGVDSFTLHAEGITLSTGKRLRMPLIRFRKRWSIVISTGSPV